MKTFYKIILAGFLLLSYFSSYGSDKEEEACFKVLNDMVASDPRFKDPDIFPDGDLTKVLYNEVDNSFVGFDRYETGGDDNDFMDLRATNPLRSGTSNEKLFLAKRNNIGTIITGSDYVISQVVGFGRDSNFDFPLDTDNGEPYDLGRGFFKEYIVYTHHLKRSSEGFPLMSCGIVRVIPLNGKSFSEISESNYFTNSLKGNSDQANLGGQKCSSGFEGEYKTQSGEDFYAMKANICALDYASDDYLKMEVISIAYDNGSSQMNEYITHPMQVQAMRDHSSHPGGLRGIRDEFLDDIVDNTCLKVIHGGSLPDRCGTAFKKTNLFSKIYKGLISFVPKSYASLEGVSFEDDGNEENAGLLGYDRLPYPLYKKLREIPNKNFQEFLLLSINQGYEKNTLYRKENDFLLTPYEETFLSCNIDYDERLQIVSEFLNNLDIDTFSIENLDYSNPKYGDCIIPYPDKDNRDVVIEGSFESNQELAQKLNGEYKTPKEVSPEIEEFSRKREEILNELNTRLEVINARFNNGELTNNELENLKNEAIQESENRLANINIASYEETQDVELVKQDNLKALILIVVLGVIGIGLIVLALKNKNKIGKK